MFEVKQVHKKTKCSSLPVASVCFPIGAGARPVGKVIQLCRSSEGCQVFKSEKYLQGRMKSVLCWDRWLTKCQLNYLSFASLANDLFLKYVAAWD